MQKFFSSLTTAFRTTPFWGRTFVVLSFFFLFVKQLVLFLSYDKLFQTIETSATIVHYLGYFVSDFLVCLVILGLVAINALIKKIFVKIINIIIISVIFFLFLLDVITIYVFQSRLSLFNLQQFITPSLGNFSWIILILIIIISILGIISFFIVQHPQFKKKQKSLLAIYFFLFSLGCFWIGIYAPDGFKSVPDNILSLNFSTITKHTSWKNETKTSDTYTDFFQPYLGKNKQKNIIVVFAESFSAIDSLHIWWTNDKLPYFDKIQKQGITFPNFISNGCTSDTSHVGFFLGIEPLKLVGSQITQYSWYHTVTEPLPQFFNELGYDTVFVSSVDLWFLNQLAFLSWIGFSHIIGTEAFEGKKTYVFDAAPDHVLYNKTLNIVEKQQTPYFLALQTISFHKPYNTPYGKTHDDALRYADKSLYYFYLKLKQQGFFENGILVIVGDHRKMEPLEEGEKEAVGDAWHAKSLATVVGAGIKSWTINTNLIQHTDFFYSLKQFAGQGRIYLSSLFNNIFSPTKQRNRWLVCCRNDYKNKNTIVFENNTIYSFANLSELASSYTPIHKYLSSYIAFQYGEQKQEISNNDLVIIGHRGSPIDSTENSLEGFFSAKQHGADGIEFDVSWTKDKQNIIMHWPGLYSTICGNKKMVYNYTLEYLQKNCPLTNGETIRTLKDMLVTIDGLFDYYFLELKVYNSKDAEEQTRDAITSVKALHMEDRVIFISYDETARKILGNTTGIIAGWDTFNTWDIELLSQGDYHYYLLPHDILPEHIVRDTETLGKRFVTYTVNTTGTLAKLYNQWIRIIITDNVPLMKEWLKQKNK